MSGFEPILGLVATGAAAVAWHFRAQLLAERQRQSTELAEQRLRRDEELADQQRRTAALFDRMVEGILVVGANGRIRLANHAAGNLFGFAPPATGRSVMETTRQHAVAALVTRLQSEPEVLNHELRLDGLAGPRFLQVNALALRTANGARDGAILVFHDLTRIRQLETTRQEFVANVSHELRTPLSLIKSAAETLVDGGRNDPKITTRFLEIIENNANRLTLLIDDLLLLARFDSGKIELARRPVNLLELLEDAAGDAALLAQNKAVTLACEVAGEPWVHADASRLRQVLSNLVDNAIKYGRAQGHVTLGARTAEADTVEVFVRDDGPGIPEEAQERIFERFYRVDKARSRDQGGTGLGLAIVKHVVQAHGGEVRVASELGRGTTFYFTLPAASAVVPCGASSET